MTCENFCHSYTQSELVLAIDRVNAEDLSHQRHEGTAGSSETLTLIVSMGLAKAEPRQVDSRMNGEGAVCQYGSAQDSASESQPAKQKLNVASSMAAACGTCGEDRPLKVHGLAI